MKKINLKDYYINDLRDLHGSLEFLINNKLSSKMNIIVTFDEENNFIDIEYE